MESYRGVALILALLVLSFLTILGGALLTTSTIDIWISDNYKASVQSLYLAEAGIDDGREVMRTSAQSPAELLASGEPLIPSRELIDSSGQSAGRYTVSLRNDNAGLTLVSLGQIGSTQKTIEAVIEKGGFPETDSDVRLTSAQGLERLAAGITGNAADVYADGQAISDYGSATNYKVAVVNGDVDLGPGTGYGVLLVRGDLNVRGDFTWNGLVLLIGPGMIQWNGFSGTINGGFFAGSVFTITDAAEIKKANRPFPYNPVAIRER